MANIIDVKYEVVRERQQPVSDLPPWLEVSLIVASKAIVWWFAAFCIGLLLKDLMKAF